MRLSTFLPQQRSNRSNLTFPFGGTELRLTTKIIQEALGESWQHPTESDEHIFDLNATAPGDRSQTPYNLGRLHVVKHQEVILGMARITYPDSRNRKVRQLPSLRPVGRGKRAASDHVSSRTRAGP